MSYSVPGNREQGTGNREQGTGNREQGVRWPVQFPSAGVRRNICQKYPVISAAHRIQYLLLSHPLGLVLHHIGFIQTTQLDLEGKHELELAGGMFQKKDLSFKASLSKQTQCHFTI